MHNKYTTKNLFIKELKTAFIFKKWLVPIIITFIFLSATAISQAFQIKTISNFSTDYYINSHMIIIISIFMFSIVFLSFIYTEINAKIIEPLKFGSFIILFSLPYSRKQILKNKYLFLYLPIFIKYILVLVWFIVLYLIIGFSQAHGIKWKINLIEQNSLYLLVNGVILAIVFELFFLPILLFITFRFNTGVVLISYIAICIFIFSIYLVPFIVFASTNIISDYNKTSKIMCGLGVLSPFCWEQWIFSGIFSHTFQTDKSFRILGVITNGMSITNNNIVRYISFIYAIIFTIVSFGLSFFVFWYINKNSWIK